MAAALRLAPLRSRPWSSMPFRGAAAQKQLSTLLSTSGPGSQSMRRALMLRDIDKDLYQIPHEVLWTPPAGRSVYGGQIIGACTLAAHKTLDAVHSEFVLSSLHSYFLTGGDSKKNILVRVERLRDGASFCTRSVVAQQDGNAIFAAELQFHKRESASIEHQEAMPQDIPQPETLPSMNEYFSSMLEDKRMHPKMAPLVMKYINAPFPVEVRPVSSLDPFEPVKVESATQHVWIRCTEDLGPANVESFLHRSALVYASDWSLASTMLLPHGIFYNHPRIGMMASLDHNLWFSALTDFRADEWMLYSMESPVLRGSRGLNIGKVYTRDGRLVATAVQEALVRLREDFKAPAPAAGAPLSGVAAEYAHRKSALSTIGWGSSVAEPGDLSMKPT